MPVPKYDELTKPLLLTLADGKPHTMKEISSLLIKQLKLTAEDIAERQPSGHQTIFKNRLGWAKTYLKKAGLLENIDRSTVVITKDGKKAIKDNPDKLDKPYLAKFPSFLEFSPLKRNHSGKEQESIEEESNDLTPDDQLDEAYNQINATLASDLLSEVLKITPYTFEKLVVDLLSKMGYGTVAYGSHATKSSGDDGIDGVIMEDKLGFSLIYMQAKQWATDRVVGQPEIQSFVGAIAGKHGDGLFVTTAKFSQKAKDYANTHHIILIDGDRLAKLMIEHDFCVSTRKTFSIKAIDSDALAEYQDE